MPANENTTEPAELPKTAADEAPVAPETAPTNSAEAAAAVAAAEFAPEAASEPAAKTEPESPLAAELAETKDKLLRALAEAENVRRRAQRDVEMATKRSIAGFAREMLTIADNLGRALSSVDKAAAEQDEMVKTVLAGIEMTAREMLNTFERNGIKRLDPLGQRFDPQMHEAMYEFEDASKPAGTVGQVVEPGYLLHGMTLRPAKVGVTKGGASAQAVPSQPGHGTAEPAAGAKSAYEDQGKKAGSQLDEEL